VRIKPTHYERLAFLCRITQKEIEYLIDTDQRLFGESFDTKTVEKIKTDPILAERLDAFVSRFGRLQDNLGDKFLPQLLGALAEKPGTAIDNLNRAERLGWIESTETWLEIRHLRNQMVHEYMEDIAVLTNALQAGHEYVNTLVKAGQALIEQANKLMVTA
jgi:hypothetical protein